MEHSIVGFFVNKRSTSAPLASCRHIVTFQVWPLLPYYYKTFQANWSHLLASLLCDNSQFLCNWLEVSPSCKWDWKVSTIAETIPPLTTRHWSRQYRLACLHAAALQSCADHIWRCYLPATLTQTPSQPLLLFLIPEVSCLSHRLCFSV